MASLAQQQAIVGAIEVQVLHLCSCSVSWPPQLGWRLLPYNIQDRKSVKELVEVA
jgi:hypothetical protein